MILAVSSFEITAPVVDAMAPPATWCTWWPSPGWSNPAGVFLCRGQAAGPTQATLAHLSPAQPSPDPRPDPTAPTAPTAMTDPTRPDPINSIDLSHYIWETPQVSKHKIGDTK